MGMQSWQTPALAATIERAYRVIEQDPTFLLEHDGGPYGLTADIYVARLFGFDEQLDHEWRITRIESVLLTPIRERLTLVKRSDEPTMIRKASYHLQSNYATASIVGELVVPLVPWKPTVEILCLRYKRRQ